MCLVAETNQIYKASNEHESRVHGEDINSQMCDESSRPKHWCYLPGNEVAHTR